MLLYRLGAIGFASLLSIGSAMAQPQANDTKIWPLLDNSKAVYVSMPELDFRAMGEGFDLPDGGRAVTALAGVPFFLFQLRRYR